MNNGASLLTGLVMNMTLNNVRVYNVVPFKQIFFLYVHFVSSNSHITVVHFKLLFLISFWHLRTVCEMKKKIFTLPSRREKNT